MFIPLNQLVPLIALMAGSVGANKAAQHKVDRGRSQALSNERERRAASEKRTAASAASTANAYANPTQESDRAKELEAQLLRVGRPGTVSPVIDALTGANSTQNISPERARAREQTDRQARAQAHLSAFADVMGSNQINAQHNAQDIESQNVGLRNWNTFVLPRQLEAANASGNGLRTLADVLQLAAQVYGTAVLSKPAAAGTEAASSGANVAAEPTMFQRPEPFSIFNTPGGRTTFYGAEPFLPGKTSFYGGPG